MENNTKYSKSKLVLIIFVVLILSLSSFLFIKSQNKKIIPLPAETTPTAVEPLKNRATIEVYFYGDYFLPETITVKEGTTINWINKSAYDMNIVSSENSSATFSQPLTGDEYTFKFETSGEYEYFNKLNPDIIGKVKVEK